MNNKIPDFSKDTVGESGSDSLKTKAVSGTQFFCGYYKVLVRNSAFCGSTERSLNVLLSPSN
ncbi:hypothetical protein [Nostoc sp.]|uniref:hypothetical protein n=1 Tax=Nostoc sp. TaxID=1180 RepID=UPI002FF544C8